MRLEIEITEEEIKTAIERKVRVAIADQTNQWSVDNYIKDMVKKHWQAAVEQMGRKFIGIEREPKYFDIACKRIEQAYAQGDFFVPKAQIKPVQETLL